MALKCKKRNLALNIENISGLDDFEDVLSKNNRGEEILALPEEKSILTMSKKYSSPEYQTVVR